MAVFVASGCYRSNPIYNKRDQGGQKDARVGDLFNPGWDDAGPTDLSGRPDLVPDPDAVPWKCQVDGDCNDSLGCTTDRCNAQNICENTLDAGHCLIGLRCYRASESPPGNSCSTCDPSVSTMVWTPRADGQACQADGLSCTQDICQAGLCVHPPRPGFCLIGGACYRHQQTRPSNPCEGCDTSQSQTAWSVAPDNYPCPADGLSCTRDYCIKGKCEHPIVDGCLIGGRCVGVGAADSANACNVCVPSKNPTGYTYAAGAPCEPSPGQGGMCFGNKCMGFSQQTYLPSGARGSGLVSAAVIPSAKGVWAAGIYRDSANLEKGMLVDVANVGSPGGVFLTGEPMQGIHYRMAVGGSGEVYYHDGSAWSTPASLRSALGARDHRSVWGASVSGLETFFIGGTQLSTSSAMDVCTLGSGGTFSCTGHSGIGSGVMLGRVFGTLTSGGGQGPVWGARMGDNTPEDIYYYSGSGSSWTTNSPHGCRDTSGTPCGGTSWHLRDMNGSSASDIWVVGSAGGILHYDGSGWSKVLSAFPSQTSHQMTAVYSSAKDKLTTLACTYDSGSLGHRVRLFNFNHDLKEWFGPVEVARSARNSEDYLLAIAGDGYANLWFVGYREVGSGGSTTLRAWILQLK
jgi:hypothetical protein